MSAITGAVGGVAGAFSSQGDKERAEGLYDDALKSARGYNTHVAGQAGTEYDKIDPTSRNAMLQALTDYQSKAQQGGLDAKARANLAAGTAASQQAAAQSAAQIQAQAARRGAAQGPAAMVAQQVATQQAGERARQTGLDSAALAEQARDAALQGQLGAASQIHGADAQRAAAQDAINQFNVRNSQQNVANDRAQADQAMKAQLGKANLFEDRQKNDVKQFGDIGSGVGGVADFALGGGFGDIASKVGGALGGAAQPALHAGEYDESAGLNLGNS